MKPNILYSGVASLAICFLTGCGQSSSPLADNSKASSASPSSPAPSSAAAVPNAANDAPKGGATPAAAAPESVNSAKDAVTGAVSQFAQSAAAQPDKVAASIGSDLAAKAKSLTQAAMDNPSLKAGLSSALQSLSSGKDTSALGTMFQQLKDTNLTPQQTQLAKEVGNLASAYAVQRNFSSLDGAQGDVATLVNSLRKGELTSAVAPLQNLAQNATLTPPQKELLGTLADKYAPGVKKATESLKQGLQAIPGLGK